MVGYVGSDIQRFKDAVQVLLKETEGAPLPQCTSILLDQITSPHAHMAARLKHGQYAALGQLDTGELDLS